MVSNCNHHMAIAASPHSYVELNGHGRLALIQDMFAWS